jgi:hypothetical protein
MRPTLGVAVCAVALVVGSSCARAPIGPYRGPQPAPGAITAFDKHWDSDVHKESQAGAPPFIVPGTTRRSHFSVGTVQIPAHRDSVVILVYGDNRPGLRMMTTAWGLPVMLDIGSADPKRFLWAILNIPVAIVQGFIPKLDGFRDAWSVGYSHLYSGGNEKRVLQALLRDTTAAFAVNTGDVVEQGRRGRQWEDFVRKHDELRTHIPYLAAPGNHERLWDPVGRANWDAVMGPPAQPLRYWYAVDLPDSMARFVFLDSDVIADPHDHYPDSLQASLVREQIRWADSALAVPARWRFVVLHHPLVTSGHYLSDWKYDDSRPLELRYRAQLLALCRKRHVTAVLAGHEHLYQRTYVRGRDGTGFWHITTGGGGSPLYRLSESQRKAALSLTLPDSSIVTWNREQSVYHYSRLTIVRRPKPGEDSVVLEVIRVRSNGQTGRIDYVNLNESPPEENRERIPGTAN